MREGLGHFIFVFLEAGIKYINLCLLLKGRKKKKKDARNFTMLLKSVGHIIFKWPTDQKCIPLFVKSINSMAWQVFGKDNSVSFSQYSLKKDRM